MKIEYFGKDYRPLLEIGQVMVARTTSRLYKVEVVIIRATKTRIEFSYALALFHGGDSIGPLSESEIIEDFMSVVPQELIFDKLGGGKQ